MAPGFADKWREAPVVVHPDGMAEVDNPVCPQCMFAVLGTQLCGER